MQYKIYSQTLGLLYGLVIGDKLGSITYNHFHTTIKQKYGWIELYEFQNLSSKINTKNSSFITQFINLLDNLSNTKIVLTQPYIEENLNTFINTIVEEPDVTIDNLLPFIMLLYFMVSKNITPDKLINNMTKLSSGRCIQDVSLASSCICHRVLTDLFNDKAWEKIKANLPCLAKEIQYNYQSHCHPALERRMQHAFSLSHKLHHHSNSFIAEELYAELGSGQDLIEWFPLVFSIIDICECNPNQTLSMAINIGGFSQPICALSTAISGAYLGYEAFSSDLVNILSKEEIDKLKLLSMRLALNYLKIDSTDNIN